MKSVLVTKVNSKCDGDRDGYDAMVLLTGRYDFGDMGQPGFYTCLGFNAKLTYRPVVQVKHETGV